MSDQPILPAAHSRPVLKVIGIGGAGCNLLGRVAATGMEGVACLAVNTDARALVGCQGVETHLLGVELQRGLGANSDPKVGRAAAEVDEARLAAWLGGADLVFILAGLGGGTGSGAAPVIARLAKAAGALVLAVVAMPFAFEGSRRHRQAILGLARLRQEADAVIPVANDLALKLIPDQAPVTQLFAIANERLADAVRGIWRMLYLPGLVQLDFGSLRALLAGHHSECRLAAAEAAGDNRVFDLWAKLAAAPGFDLPDAWEGAGEILVSIVGGEDLIAADFEWLMRQITERAPRARLAYGVALDPAFAGRLSVTLIASHWTASVPEETSVPAVAVLPAAAASVSDNRAELASQFLPTNTPSERPRSRFVPPAPVVSPDKAQQIYRRQAGRSRRKKDLAGQALLPLEIVSKGHFEKSEPTVYDGEDLDVPTYIRRGVVLN